MNVDVKYEYQLKGNATWNWMVRETIVGAQGGLNGAALLPELERLIRERTPAIVRIRNLTILS